MGGMDAKDRIIEEQRLLIEQLHRRIEELELTLAKATKDSSNSSKSPSSDIVKPPKRDAQGKAGRKKRKRGGQRGHKRTLREPLPPDRVDEAFVYEIPDEEVRDRKLTPIDDFEIIQHIELLDMPIHVTEHRLRKYLTPDGKNGRHAGARTCGAADLRAANVGYDRLVEIAGTLQLLDDCNLDGRCFASAPCAVAICRNSATAWFPIRCPARTKNFKRRFPYKRHSAVTNRA